MNKIIVFLFIGFFSTFQLYAKLNYAVVRLCLEKDGEPFQVSTDSRIEAKKKGFIRYKVSDKYYKKIKMYLDGATFTKFKPYKNNCYTLYKVPAGRHTISIDFQSVEYTTLVPQNTYSAKFKPDLLYNGKIELATGTVATVKINQSQNKITLYQALDNKPVENCEKECEVPVGIPIYFMKKSENEKVLCPVDYKLFVSHDYEKNFDCYKKESVLPILKKFVKERNIRCKVNVEYAFFNVFGDGCIINLEPDKFGLNPKMPTIKMIPLDQQKVKYFLKIGDKKPKLYKFDADRKGQRITPKEDEVIILNEEMQ